MYVTWTSEEAVGGAQGHVPCHRAVQALCRAHDMLSAAQSCSPRADLKDHDSLQYTAYICGYMALCCIYPKNVIYNYCNIRSI